MRLFVALTLNARDRKRISSATRTLREQGLPVRWIDAEAFHVTLKFLGDLRKHRIAEIEGAMEVVAAKTPPFSTQLQGFGAFPTLRRPHVIWLGVHATAELRCLKQDLEWTLGEVGFETEVRAFHPHVTLGRVESNAGVGVFRSLDRIVADLDFRADIKVRSIELMRSHLSADGARYSVVASARLKP
jgi:2'-5' RNA ligase